jgi:hypothetical protein
MAAPSPLASLTAASHPLGNEIDLDWELPATLPAQYRVDIFKKQGADITQGEIDQIMGGTPVEGVDVFHPGNEYHGMHDMQVTDGKTYYYRGIVVNTETSEYSSSVGASATPDFTAAPDVTDLKKIVLEAIKRIFRSRGIVIDKHVFVTKDYNVEDPKFPLVTISRAPATVSQRFIGEYVGAGDFEAQGMLYMDSVYVIWSSDHPVERRDRLSIIFRSAAIETWRYLVSQAEVVTAEISFGQDIRDERFEGNYVLSNSMTVRAIVQTVAEFEAPEEKGYPLEMETTPLTD